MIPQIAEGVFEEGLELMVEKNDDYTSNRGDNIQMTGTYGVAIRLLDKVSRLLNLTHPSRDSESINYESIRDTFIDVMNYGNIGVQLVDNTWSLRSDHLLVEEGEKILKDRDKRKLIDHLKNYNYDGDEVLKGTAQRLMALMVSPYAKEGNEDGE
jgi:hypothetical protein